MKTRRTNIMTNAQRRAMRQRRERNQRIGWIIQDAIGAVCLSIGAVCLFGSIYIGTLVAWGFMS